MNFSEINTRLRNNFLQSTNPDTREIGELLRDIIRNTQSELDALRQQVSQLQQQISRR